MLVMTAHFTKQQVLEVCRTLDIDLSIEGFSEQALRHGMNVELEHGSRTPDLNVTNDDPILTAKLAIAHLREFPDYYLRLEHMRRLGEAAWAVEREPGMGIVGPSHQSRATAVTWS